MYFFACESYYFKSPFSSAILYPIYDRTSIINPPKTNGGHIHSKSFNIAQPIPHMTTNAAIFLMTAQKLCNVLFFIFQCLSYTTFSESQVRTAFIFCEVGLRSQLVETSGLQRLTTYVFSEKYIYFPKSSIHDSVALKLYWSNPIVFKR